MKALMISFSILTISVFSVSSLSAQGESWRIICLSGDTLNACRLDSLPAIILFATCSDRFLAIPIDSIEVLIGVNQRRSSSQAVSGLLLGAAAGAIIGSLTYQRPEGLLDIGPGGAALAGAVFGAVAGCAVGVTLRGSSNEEETYDLRPEKTLRMKRRILLQAF